MLLFWSSFLAATILPFSSEVHLYALIESGYSVFWLLIAASVGNTIGGMTGYVLGYFARWDWIDKYLRIKREKVLKHEESANKYGVYLALLCWLPIVGDPLSVGLGLFKFNWKKVLILMFIGKAARYAAVVYFT